MGDLSQSVLYYGTDNPLPEQIPLRAGPVSLVYEAGTIRYVKLGDTEILHQVYSAVRDHNWGTVPGVLSDVEMDIKDDTFRIQYTSTHQQGDIHFVWTGTITGEADGTITFKKEGEALSTFQRNRIGFCVLHPMNCAGLDCTVLHVDGTHEDGKFPEFIAPHQPFFRIRSITHEALPGLKVEVLMEGETFEMEDQRNWIDASYKTYCTPLGLPFPVTVETGTKVEQTITLKLHGEPPTLDAGSSGLTYAIHDETSAILSPLGLASASHGEPLTEREIERLKALHLAHLRVDVKLWQEDAQAILTQAAEEAKAIGARLEVALHITDKAEDELALLRGWLQKIKPPVARWLVFHQNEKSTSEKWAILARGQLKEYDQSIPVGAGTDAFFTELNRERPPVAVLDFISYSTNPQVHAFDNASLTETLAVQTVTVNSARQFSEDKPITVSPVTFKMRWNPNATGPAPETPPGELPAQVDERQMSLYGACWTLGSIRYLAEGQVDGITYFETTGWLGVMERENGSPLPDLFQSIPGGVYPMYHIFADVGEFAGADVVASTSSDRLKVDGLVLRKNGSHRILLANYTAETQAVTLSMVRGAYSKRLLDASSVEFAMHDPEGFRAQAGESIMAEGSLELKLPPYAILRLDSEGGTG